MDTIVCECCGNRWHDIYPELGDYTVCQCCNAIGYGSYDYNGFYFVEWIDAS